MTPPGGHAAQAQHVIDLTDSPPRSPPHMLSAAPPVTASDPSPLNPHARNAAQISQPHTMFSSSPSPPSSAPQHSSSLSTFTTTSSAAAKLHPTSVPPVTSLPPRPPPLSTSGTASCTPLIPTQTPNPLTSTPSLSSPLPVPAYPSRVCLLCKSSSSRFSTGPDGFQTLCFRCSTLYQQRRLILYYTPPNKVSVLQTPSSTPVVAVSFHYRVSCHSRNYCKPVVVAYQQGFQLPIPELDLRAAGLLNSPSVVLYTGRPPTVQPIRPPQPQSQPHQFHSSFQQQRSAQPPPTSYPQQNQRAPPSMYTVNTPAPPQISPVLQHQTSSPRPPPPMAVPCIARPRQSVFSLTKEQIESIGLPSWLSDTLPSGGGNQPTPTPQPSHGQGVSTGGRRDLPSNGGPDMLQRRNETGNMNGEGMSPVRTFGNCVSSAGGNIAATANDSLANGSGSTLAFQSGAPVSGNAEAVKTGAAKEENEFHNSFDANRESGLDSEETPSDSRKSRRWLLAPDRRGEESPETEEGDGVEENETINETTMESPGEAGLSIGEGRNESGHDDNQEEAMDSRSLDIGRISGGGDAIENGGTCQTSKGLEITEDLAKVVADNRVAENNDDGSQDVEKSAHNTSVDQATRDNIESPRENCIGNGNNAEHAAVKPLPSKDPVKDGSVKDHSAGHKDLSTPGNVNVDKVHVVENIRKIEVIDVDALDDDESDVQCTGTDTDNQFTRNVVLGDPLTPSSSVAMKVPGRSAKRIRITTEQNSQDIPQPFPGLREALANIKEEYETADQPSAATSEHMEDVEKHMMQAPQTMSNINQLTTETEARILQTNQPLVNMMQPTYEAKPLMTEAKQHIANTQQSNTDTKQSVNEQSQLISDFMLHPSSDVKPQYPVMKKPEDIQCSTGGPIQMLSENCKRPRSPLSPSPGTIQRLLQNWNGKFSQSEASEDEREILESLREQMNDPLFSLQSPDATFFSIKAKYGDTVHRTAIPRGMPVIEFVAKLKALFQVEREFAVQYQDDEKDFVRISSDSDMEEMFNVAKTHRICPIRVRVVEKVMEE